MNAYDEVLSEITRALSPVLAAAGFRMCGHDIATANGVAVFFGSTRLNLAFCEDLRYRDSYYMVGRPGSEMTFDAVVAGRGWIPIEQVEPQFGRTIADAYRALDLNQFIEYSSVADLLGAEIERHMPAIERAIVNGALEQG